MTSQAGTFQRVTVAEAVIILGVSAATVRRMVKSGRLTGERVLRPQGSAFVVLLPEDASAATDDASNTSHDAWRLERSNALPDVSQETALAAWVVTVMAPLAEANARQHETIERQASEVADLREQRGRMAAELERAASGLVAADGELVAGQARIRLLTLAVAALVILALVAGTLAASGWLR